MKKLILISFCLIIMTCPINKLFAEYYWCLDVVGLNIGATACGAWAVKFGYINPKLHLGFGTAIDQDYGLVGGAGDSGIPIVYFPLYIYVLLSSSEEEISKEIANKTVESKQVIYKIKKKKIKPVYLYAMIGLTDAYEYLGESYLSMQRNSKMSDFGIAYQYSSAMAIKLSYLTFSCSDYYDEYFGGNRTAVNHQAIHLSIDFTLGWGWRVK